MVDEGILFFFHSDAFDCFEGDPIILPKLIGFFYCSFLRQGSLVFNHPIQIHLIRSLKEIIEDHFLHVDVVVLLDQIHLLKEQLKIIHLLDDVDVGGMNIEYQLGGFMDIPIKRIAQFDGPLQGQGQAFHQTGHPEQLK